MRLKLSINPFRVFVQEPEEDEFEVVYVTPKEPPSAYMAETFDDDATVESRWIRSQAKKEGVDEDIAKYDGEWMR